VESEGREALDAGYTPFHEVGGEVLDLCYSGQLHGLAENVLEEP
jgi:hypothetical protein